MSRPDCRPLLGQIACETLVVVGDSDPLTPPALAKAIADGVAGAHLMTVPSCGHLPTFKRPAVVTEVWRNWADNDLAKKR